MPCMSSVAVVVQEGLHSKSFHHGLIGVVGSGSGKQDMPL
jgi:hypothetical protein